MVREGQVKERETGEVDYGICSKIREYQSPSIYGPRRDKTCLQGFRQNETQTSLLSYRD